MDSPPHPLDCSSGRVTPTVEEASPALENYSLLVAKCLLTNRLTLEGVMVRKSGSGKSRLRSAPSGSSAFRTKVPERLRQETLLRVARNPSPAGQT